MIVSNLCVYLHVFVCACGWYAVCYDCSCVDVVVMLCVSMVGMHYVMVVAVWVWLECNMLWLCVHVIGMLYVMIVCVYSGTSLLSPSLL